MSHTSLNELVNLYLSTNPDTDRSGIINKELEVKFGTKGIKPITRIEFNNVIQKLISLGFTGANLSGNYLLRIMPEYIDQHSGKTKTSNVRVEIHGLDAIQEYCKTNNIEAIAQSSITYNQKKGYKVNDAYPAKIVEMPEFNFRVALQSEVNLLAQNPIIKQQLGTWQNTKKVFRYLNRITLTHADYPFKVDLTIVKMSNMSRSWPIATYNIGDSGVFTNIEHFEMEIELMNEKIWLGNPFYETEILSNYLRKGIKYILCGLQGTNYPIAYSEQQQVLKEYLNLIKYKYSEDRLYVTPMNFIGPSSQTLQVNNIMPINVDAQVPNIRKEYTVTDKADGDRKMCFINKEGKIYLITTLLKIQFTGVLTLNDKLFNSLLDGEHIIHNKQGNFINLYVAFDIYFLKNKDIREKYFLPSVDDEGLEETLKENYRLNLLLDCIKNLNVKSIIEGSLVPLRIENKNFYYETKNQSIFMACNFILSKEVDGTFEYNTDGLIFTPKLLGVGGDSIKRSNVGPLRKFTWPYSLKWKPPQFNTIDFLITTKKDVNNQDSVSNVFSDGLNVSSVTQLIQYKTLILRCGFDESKHGYINPCQDIINNNLPTTDMAEDTDKYKPMPFYPTNPSDYKANICNIVLTEMGLKQEMVTEEGDVFEDNMIVEFKYDQESPEEWRWTPLRVRYDKTSELRQGFKNYGNAYHVANSNWQSIHNPVTSEMISTGTKIPTELDDDDVYYNKGIGANYTKGLRDFHNLYIKKILINSVSQRGNTLIDYAVGKGGDFPKWINSKLSFVFGLDISKDNIENRLDGACARYLNYRKKFGIMPSALFITANSTLNIKEGQAQFTETGKTITNAIFGIGPNDKSIIGEGVSLQYGKVTNGFNISSCQFAIHYFFETANTLQNFICNVSECTQVGGYFIGTSYNGKEIFDLLKSKKQGESISLFSDDKSDKKTKIWEITKDYDHETFNDDISCLGYGITVYQETINKYFKEYLVNYNYLKRVLENYGFTVLSSAETKQLNVPSSIGSFRQLYTQMEEITKRTKNKFEYGEALNMSANEKYISFKNNYFIFKKVRNVDTKSIMLSSLHELPSHNQYEEFKSDQAEMAVAAVTADRQSQKPKKLKKKLTLINDDKDKLEQTQPTVDIPNITLDTVEVPTVDAVETSINIEASAPPVEKSRKKKTKLLKKLPQ